MTAVLVVDDDPGVREVCSVALAAAGYDVRTAPDGVEALRLLADSVADLVVCDLFMPEMDGLETIAEVRRRWPATKVLAISGGAPSYPDLLAVAATLGAVRTLAKPFMPAELARAATAVLAAGPVSAWDSDRPELGEGELVSGVRAGPYLLGVVVAPSGVVAWSVGEGEAGEANVVEGSAPDLSAARRAALAEAHGRVGRALDELADLERADA